MGLDVGHTLYEQNVIEMYELACWWRLFNRGWFGVDISCSSGWIQWRKREFNRLVLLDVDGYKVSGIGLYTI